MADRHTPDAPQAAATRPRKSVARSVVRGLALPLLGTGVLLASTLVPGASATGAPERIVPAAQKLPPFQVVTGAQLRPAFVAPRASYRLTAEYGDSNGPWAHGHTGLDFAAPIGTTIRSIARGTVVSAGYEGSYGNKVVVRLASGVELWFCHLDDTYVTPGEVLDVGTPLGEVGSTGNVTGPHLHLEVRWADGEPTDPDTWLRSKGVTP